MDELMDELRPPLLTQAQRHAWLDENWRDCLIGLEITATEYAETKVPTDGYGIYFLWCRRGGLLYVGMTNSPRVRFLAHKRAGKIRFASWSFLPVPYAYCPDIERAYIRALEPPMNRMYDQPRWPGHALMVEAIQALWGEKTYPMDYEPEVEGC